MHRLHCLMSRLIPTMLQFAIKRDLRAGLHRSSSEHVCVIIKSMVNGRQISPLVLRTAYALTQTVAPVAPLQNWGLRLPPSFGLVF